MLKFIKEKFSKNDFLLIIMFLAGSYVTFSASTSIGSIASGILGKIMVWCGIIVMISSIIWFFEIRRLNRKKL